MIAGFSRNSVAFVGAADLGQEFMELFGRSVAIDTDDALLASEEEIQSELRQMAKNRGLHWPPGMKLAVDFPTLVAALAPGMRRRFERYEEVRKQTSPDGPFFADWEQNPEGGKAVAGALVPVMLTHHFIVSHRKQRRVTAMESLALQGLHMFPETGCSHGISPRAEAIKLSKVTLAQIRSLSGNGIHAPCWQAWFLYVIANTVKVSSTHIDVAWHVSSCPWDDEDDLVAVEDQEENCDK